MKLYLFRFSLVILASLLQQVFLPALTNALAFITAIVLVVFSYDSNLEELLAYSFLSGFLVGAFSGSEMLLHIVGHLMIGGILVLLKANNLLPSKHRTRLGLLAAIVALYSGMLLVPLELNLDWWLMHTLWSVLLTAAVYVLLLPLFSRIVKRERHTLFYG